MNGKRAMAIFAVILLLGACIPVPLAAVPTVTPSVLPPTASPTLRPPTETATLPPEPTNTVTPVPPEDFEIPVFPGAQNVTYNFLSQMGQAGNSVYYVVSESPDKVQAFYMDELTRAGWEWVYTDIDESRLVSFPFPTWVMEFKKGGHKLGIGLLGQGEEGSLIFAGVDFSGGRLITNYIAAIAGGLDLMGPFESHAGPDAMRFSSTLLEFTHPAEWQVTDEPMQIFETDKGINYMPNKNNCSVDLQPCFVTLSASPSSHFDKPISFRVYRGLTNRTLEEMNILRWEDLNSIASAPQKCCFFPEHFALAGSLKSIEVRNLTLADGTPALQRLYRWTQEDVKEPIVGTYTLFISGEVFVEFHTDFTSTDWEKIRAAVEQVIASMKINKQR